MPSIPWASYFRADHLILHPLASYFSCQSFNSPPIYPLGELFLWYPSLRRVMFVLSIPWASYFRALLFDSPPLSSYFRADHLTLRPSIPLASYFCTLHRSIPLASCFLCHPSLGESYFHADHLILHPLASYFNLYHITLHPSILLASYFCAVHPLGELFSCLPFNSPSVGKLFFVPII